MFALRDTIVDVFACTFFKIYTFYTVTGRTGVPARRRSPYGPCQPPGGPASHTFTWKFMPSRQDAQVYVPTMTIDFGLNRARRIDVVLRDAARERRPAHRRVRTERAEMQCPGPGERATRPRRPAESAKTARTEERATRAPDTALATVAPPRRAPPRSSRRRQLSRQRSEGVARKDTLNPHLCIHSLVEDTLNPHRPPRWAAWRHPRRRRGGRPPKWPLQAKRRVERERGCKVGALA